jgi:hypothetical protein
VGLDRILFPLRDYHFQTVIFFSHISVNGLLLCF